MCVASAAMAATGAKQITLAMQSKNDFKRISLLLLPLCTSPRELKLRGLLSTFRILRFGGKTGIQQFALVGLRRNKSVSLAARASHFLCWCKDSNQRNTFVLHVRRVRRRDIPVAAS